MSIIDLLRILGTIVWAAVLVAHAKPLWRVLVGRPLYYDPLRSIFAATALMVIGYHVHWLFSARSESIYVGLNLFSLILGVMTISVVRRYQGVRND